MFFVIQCLLPVSEFFLKRNTRFMIKEYMTDCMFKFVWWNEKRLKNVPLRALDILYGCKPESNIFQALNYYVIDAKYHIFVSWLNKISPSFEIFCLILTEKILCKHTIAFKNNTLRKFRAKWETQCAWAAANIFVSEDVPLLLFFDFLLVFHWSFGVRDTSIVNIASNSSIVTSICTVSKSY